MDIKRIYDTWNEGIVLDKHILESKFLGYNDKGKKRFENTRTELGNLVYRLKYKNDISTVKNIMNLITDILEKWNLKEKIDIVLPVPPSKTNRKYQPVFELSKAIAKYLNKDVCLDVMINQSKLHAKDGYKVKGKIIQTKPLKYKSNILVIDDLYSTGLTLNEVCRILRKDNNVEKIYCLVLTRTRRE